MASVRLTAQEDILGEMAQQPALEVGVLAVRARYAVDPRSDGKSGRYDFQNKTDTNSSPRVYMSLTCPPLSFWTVYDTGKVL